MESGLLPAQGRRRKGRWVADVRARLISDREKKRRERRGAGLGGKNGPVARLGRGGKGEGTGRIAAGPSRPKPERGKGFVPSFVFFFF